jgi:fumarate hydratase subunit beta
VTKRRQPEPVSDTVLITAWTHYYSGRNLLRVETPVKADVIEELSVGDRIEVYGKIFTGRDAVLPILRRMIEEEKDGLVAKLNGAIMMHAGFSVAGFGPTTSNKVAIEGSIPALAKAGVRIHIGKGSLGDDTVKSLKRYNSIYAVTPPVTALLMQKVKSERVIAFESEGMEAMHEVEVEGLTAIVAIAHGKSIFGARKVG